MRAGGFNPVLAAPAVGASLVCKEIIPVPTAFGSFAGCDPPDSHAVKCHGVEREGKSQRGFRGVKFRPEPPSSDFGAAIPGSADLGAAGGGDLESGALL